MKATDAIHGFFERQDAISPNGGRKVENRELLDYAQKNGPGSTRELGELCAAELGVELDAMPVKK